METEKLLLSSHQAMEKSKKIPRNKWQKVADYVNSYKYNFTAEQCRLKIKSLKEKYARQKRKNRTSGDSPATDCDEDENLMETFDSFPDMNPDCIYDSNETGPSTKDSGSEGDGIAFKNV